MDGPPTSEAQVAFVFFGDAGTGGAGQYEVAEAVERWCDVRRCDFVALLGDNFYPAGVSRRSGRQWSAKFEEPYAALSLPFRVALGNHDRYGNIGGQLRHAASSEGGPRWELPGRFYTFRTDVADVFVIDSGAFGPAQRRWLEAGLASATGPWKIVYGHHPIRSHGAHGPMPTLQKQLAPILEAGGADFYLSGHEHDKQVLAGHPTLVVVGTGGAPPREVGRGDDTAYAGNTLGFGYLALDGESAELSIVDTAGEVEFTQTWHRPRE